MTTYKHIKGGEELARALQEFPGKFQANVMRGGLRAGAKPIREDARSRARKHTGTMAEGIKIGSRLVGPNAIAYVKMTGAHAFLGPWMEYGVAAHALAPKKAQALLIAGGEFGGLFFAHAEHPGLRPEPFMRPALITQATNALQAVAAYARGRLTKEGINAPDVEVDELK
jgi:hypothetical protein